MNTVSPPSVGYFESARRHFQDANTLLRSSRKANAGHLFGVAAECGVKALLVASRVPIDTEGSIGSLPGVKGKGFRDHMPNLAQALTDFMGNIPDGRRAATYLSTLSGLGNFSDWRIEHRYWREAALPLGSIERWQSAAGGVMTVLDQAKEDGIL